MSEEKKRFIYSLVFPGFFLLLLWAVKFFEISMELSFIEGGVYPRKLSGLQGILFSPLIHGDWKHLLDNSGPVFLLSLALFYFYRDIAYKIWGLIYLMGGILLWGIGREAYHIGASGLIYGLAAFLFLSGLIRRVRNLTAISLLIVFWYSGMVWGVLPFDFEVSFEAHACGAVSGLVLALVYRDQGPEAERSGLDDEEQYPEEGPEKDQDEEQDPEEGPEKDPSESREEFGQEGQPSGTD